MSSTDAAKLVPSAIDPEAWRALENKARRLRFQRGEFLWHAGDQPRGVHILLEGSVRIVRERSGRLALIHMVQTSGQIFGEIPLFAGTAYPASAIAASRTEGLLIQAPHFLDALRHTPILLETLLGGMARRVVELVGRIDENTLASVRSRLAHYLRANIVETGGEPIVEVGSQQMLAERIGTVREVVAREMVRLQKSEVIASRGRGRVAILDRDALDIIDSAESGIPLARPFQ